MESQAGNKGTKKRWVQRGSRGKVKEASMSSAMVGFLHREPPAGPMLTLFFASITVPLSTSGSTRSRSPVNPTACRGVHPCDTTTRNEKNKRSTRKKTQQHKRLVIISAQQHHHNNGQPTRHHILPSQPFTPSNYNTLQRKHHGFTHEKINISSTKTHTDILKGGI